MGKVKSAIERLRVALMNQEKYISYLRSEGVKIGSNCDIAKTAIFGSEPFLISIGNNVRITRGVKLITHDGGLWTLRHMGLLPQKEVKYGNICIGDNCNISWDVTIMPNVHIGDNCVIAAGAVVTKDIPSGEVWGGYQPNGLSLLRNITIRSWGIHSPHMGCPIIRNTRSY